MSTQVSDEGIKPKFALDKQDTRPKLTRILSGDVDVVEEGATLTATEEAKMPPRTPPHSDCGAAEARPSTTPELCVVRFFGLILRLEREVGHAKKA